MDRYVPLRRAGFVEVSESPFRWETPRGDPPGALACLGERIRSFDSVAPLTGFGAMTAIEYRALNARMVGASTPEGEASRYLLELLSFG